MQCSSGGELLPETEGQEGNQRGDEEDEILGSREEAKL